jgi:hypothetical protein
MDISASQTQSISALSLQLSLHNPGFVPLLTPVPSPYPYYPMPPSTPSLLTHSLDHQNRYKYTSAYPPDHVTSSSLTFVKTDSCSNAFDGWVPTHGHSDSAIARENHTSEESIQN